jgi:hypothetical protein
MTNTRRLAVCVRHLCAVPTAAGAEAADNVYKRPEQLAAGGSSGTAVEALPTPRPEDSQALSEGLLDPSTLPFDVVRALMRSEPTMPSETEGGMGALGKPGRLGRTVASRNELLIMLVDLV